MACEQLHPHGFQDKNHSECCGGDNSYHLAPESIWYL